MYSCCGSPHPPASPGNMQTAVPGAFTKICARRPNPLNPLRYDWLITSLPEQLRRLPTRKQYSLHHLFILNKLQYIKFIHFKQQALRPCFLKHNLPFIIQLFPVSTFPGVTASRHEGLTALAEQARSEVMREFAFPWKLNTEYGCPGQK